MRTAYTPLAVITAIAFAILVTPTTFFSTGDDQQVFEITMIIVLGISILNLGRPLIALAGAKYPLGRIFTLVYLPAGVIFVANYFLLASNHGVIGVAWGNVINYTILTMLLFGVVTFTKELTSPVSTTTAAETTS